MDIRKIRRLIELLEDSDVTEIEIAEGEESVRITRGAPAAAQVPAPAPVQPAPSHQAPQAPAAGSEAPAAEEETGIKVEAPMVGTFYRASSPESEPFVREGDRVNVGDTLCIIEAMKLFNEIESEYSGRVKKILAENAQPVEYGEPLFLIEPDG
ncbi:acetyl-CoA carboxylase biotin carboxyl carrier protein [Thiohalorhabdus methylotrophus]|uniref:Biotin carboxyl carrier protein of acetyl-CoA carboxylase n=1 Tax=Thiohalorhabdus methylotrophus TaxID=3242694 RepID=A0ABV4TRZ6_9GAMM